MIKLNEPIRDWCNAKIFIPTFGSRDVAEKLIEWNEGKRDGDWFIKEGPFGIELKGIADSEGPRVKLSIDERAVIELIKSIPNCTKLCIESYGIGIITPGETKGKDDWAVDFSKVLVYLAGNEGINDGKEIHEIDLFDENPGEVELGTILIREDGFYFLKYGESLEFEKKKKLQQEKLKAEAEEARRKLEEDEKEKLERKISNIMEDEPHKGGMTQEEEEEYIGNQIAAYMNDMEMEA